MPDFDTLAEILYRHGYDTAGIPGSMCAEPRFGLAQGFAYYRDMSMEDFLVGSRLYYTPLPFLFARSVAVTEGTTPPLTRKTLHYLRGRRGVSRPFFLWVHFLDPHHHYDPPLAYVTPEIYRRWRLIQTGKLSADDWAGRVTRRELYNGEVRYVDAAVGRVLDTVKESGMDTSTVVVITADHGESFWEHGDNGHGSSVYAEVTDIPLLVRAPGVLPAGKVVDTQVSQVDIFATVLDLAGVPAAKPTQSRSLVPLARGEAPAFDGWAFTSSPYAGDTSVVRGTDGPRAAVFSGAKGTWSFYDLQRDKWMRWPQRDVPWGEPYVRAINAWRAGNDELRRRYHVRYRKDKMVEAVMRALGYVH
jgi:arylsulfatase A-like enzyme